MSVGRSRVLSLVVGDLKPPQYHCGGFVLTAASEHRDAEQQDRAQRCLLREREKLGEAGTSRDPPVITVQGTGEPLEPRQGWGHD